MARFVELTPQEGPISDLIVKGHHYLPLKGGQFAPDRGFAARRWPRSVRRERCRNKRMHSFGYASPLPNKVAVIHEQGW